MTDNIRRNWPVYLLLAAVTIAIYWRVTGFGFVNFDDHQYIIDNPHIKQGINPRSLTWALTRQYDSNWMPLVWVSYMIDHETGGGAPGSKRATENPAPYHRTNLLLHVLNTVLLFAFLNAVTGMRWRSAFVAGLFAVHPMHVQSVAWIAERKDVLSTFFLLVTLAAYVWYAAKPSVGRYAAVVVALALGLMSKPMLVTVPLLLLLMDVWPLRRAAGWAEDKPSPWRRLVLEKLPLLAMAAAVGIVTLVQQRHAGAVASLADYSVGVRLANAVVSYVAYALKMVWPAKLAFFYPHPLAAMPPWWYSEACCMSLPRSRTRRAASSTESVPAMASAVYSPRLCPAITTGCDSIWSPNCSRAAARPARLTVKMAG